MEIVPWKSFRDLSPFRRDRDFEKTWARFFDEAPFSKAFSGQWLPRVDVSEADGKLMIKAELPGLEAKDINISIVGDILSIKGEKKKEEEEKDEQHYRSERYYGSFERAFQLPGGIKEDDVDAVFEKGVLTITLPRVEDAGQKEIKIKAK